MEAKTSGAQRSSGSGFTAVLPPGSPASEREQHGKWRRGAGWTGPDHCVKAGLNLHKCTYLPFICEVAETEKDLFN